MLYEQYNTVFAFHRPKQNSLYISIYIQYVYNYININVIIWNLTTIGKIFDFEDLATVSGDKSEVKDTSDSEPQRESKGKHGMLLWYKFIHYCNKFKCTFELKQRIQAKLYNAKLWWGELLQINYHITSNYSCSHINAWSHLVAGVKQAVTIKIIV